jgi:hypothetical protein
MAAGRLPVIHLGGFLLCLSLCLSVCMSYALAACSCVNRNQMSYSPCLSYALAASSSVA